MSDGPDGVIFEKDEQTAVNGVDFEFQRLLRWREPVVTPDATRVAIPRDGRGIEDQTIDLLEPKPQLIKGVRGESVGAYGEQTITYHVPGQLWYTTDDGDTLQEFPGGLTQFVEDAGNVVVDRRGWGAPTAEIDVLDDIDGEPGDYVDLNVPHQINARTDQTPMAQRGGTRKVQITGRTPKPGSAMLQLEDAGNLAQTMPAPEDPVDDDGIPVPEFTLAARSENPLTVAEATVTNDTELEDVGARVEWQYAVGDSEPTADGTDFGPLALGFGTDVIAVPAVPSGSHIWVRARSQIVSTGERSDWSAWQDITLGPDDDGTGGTLPPFLLALEIDPDTGELSASATSTVAQITKVYFDAGASGGAAPSYADVLAGSVDASGPPFTAAALATMAEGETRTVGAIGEDALGNRTVQINASITRALDTGSGAGTPGNFTFKFAAGDGVIIPASLTGDVERIPEWNTSPAIFNFSKTKSLQIQCPVLKAGPSGAKVGVRGIRFAGDTPTYLAVSSDAPSVDVDSRNMIAGVLWANAGGYVDLDESFQIDNVNIEPVIAGHVGGETILGDLTITALSVAASVPPPTETPDPVFPTGMIARWKMEEGSGLSVENDVTPGTLDLVLNPSFPPGWVTNALYCHGVTFFRLTIAEAQLTTDLRTSAAFFYIKPVTVPGLAAYWRIANANGDGPGSGGGDSPSLTLVGIGGGQAVFEVRLGDPVVTVTASVSIAAGEEATFGYIHDGSTLTVYVNGVACGSAACAFGIEWDSPPAYFIGCPHGNLTSEQTDVEIGDYTLWDGGLTADDLPSALGFASAHATLRLKYPGLP